MLVPEFEHHEKSIWWHLFIGTESLLLIVLSILLQNYTFAVLIFVIWVVIMMRVTGKPQMITFRIDESAITLGQKTWHFKEIANFSIDKFGDKNSLVFTPNGKLQMPIRIPVRSSEEIRERLKNSVKEVEYSESIIDILSKFIRI